MRSYLSARSPNSLFPLPTPIKFVIISFSSEPQPYVGYQENVQTQTGAVELQTERDGWPSPFMAPCACYRDSLPGCAIIWLRRQHHRDRDPPHHDRLPVIAGRSLVRRIVFSHCHGFPAILWKYVQILQRQDCLPHFAYCFRRYLICIHKAHFILIYS